MKKHSSSSGYECQAQIARSGSCKNPPQALQHPHRASLRGLDPALHPGKRYPQEMGKPEVKQFLSHLTVERDRGGKGVVSPLDAIG